MSSFGATIAFFFFIGMCTADPSTVPVATSSGPLLVPVQQLFPKPYEFGFEFGDGLGMNQHRREVADGTGVVRGSYGYLDPFGVNRVVEYTADADGYNAVIRSNEPGTASHNAANAVYYYVQPPPAAIISQGLQASLPKIAI